MRPIDADEISKQAAELSRAYLRMYRKTEDTVWESRSDAVDHVVEMINDAPTIEAEPAKHSHWFYPFSELDINRCWECGMYVQDKINNVRETFKFCPNCGARMDGDT